MKANGEDANKALTEKKPETIFDLVNRMMPAIKQALPNAGVTAERITRIVVSALRMNPKLASCTKMSLLGGIMSAAQLGLEINSPLGQAYLVPFRNNQRNCIEAVFIIGYQGIIDLCYRSGFYNLIDAKPVYRNDEFRYSLGLNPDLVHIPADKPEGEPTKYYAIYRTKDGFSHFFVMTNEQIMDHAKRYSKAWDPQKNCFKFGSAWRDSYPYMAMKTCIKGLLKYAKKSADLQTAIAIDENVNTAHVEKIGDQDNLIIDSDFQTPEQEKTPENQIEDKTSNKQEDTKENPKQPSPFEQKAIERNREELRQLLDSDFISDKEKQNGLAWLKTKEASNPEKLDEKIRQIEKYIQGRKDAEKHFLV